MKRAINIITVLALILYCACEKEDLNAQSIEDPGLCWIYVDGEFVEGVPDVVPEYLDGGEQGFFAAIGKTLKYPPYAREHGFQGWCHVQYVITETGAVENITAVQDPGGGIGDALVAAVRTATQGTAFSPGILNQEAVRVRKEVRAPFRLQ
jgi:hypothetical protein